MDAYDRTMLILIAFTVFGFLLAGIGILGEVLGWWNDIGEVIITVGTIIGGLAAMVTLVFGSTRHGVQRVERTVTANHTILTSMDTKLDKLEKLDELDVIQATLDRQTGVLGRQLAVLERIDARL